jgi:MscS family membrane protein
MNGFIKALHISSLPLVNMLIVVGSFLILAIISDIFISKVLKRIVKLSKTDLDDKIISILRLPAFFSIILLGIIHSLSIVEIIPKIKNSLEIGIYTILITIWSAKLIKISGIIIRRTIYKLSDITGLNKNLDSLITNFVKISIFAIGFMLILSMWKIDISPLIASAGIASAAVALAARETIANFFGGISIFLDKPYKIGDYIDLDQKERGEVVAIGVRSTRIKTRDDILITIPNSLIANSKIINESEPVPHFRARVPLSVEYSSDLELIESILIDVAVNTDNVLSEPKPEVRYRYFGDSSLNLELLCWCKEPSLRGRTIHYLIKRIHTRFIESGIKMPYPHREITIKK